jgi:hypothetical protein
VPFHKGECTDLTKHTFWAGLCGARIPLKVNYK